VACFKAPFRFSRAAMRRFTQAAGAFSVVAETADGSLAGFIVIQMGRDRGACEGYVVTLDVAEEFRRQGVAGLLLEEAEGKVLAQGGASMGLHVWTENGAAIRFYEQRGYARMQLHAAFYDAERDAYGYRKALS
jgi:ribosomal-protein-alanine N-acetyltransferase